jgi:hypothetical protein
MNFEFKNPKKKSDFGLGSGSWISWIFGFFGV